MSATDAVKTIRCSFTVAGHKATLTVPVVAGAAIGVSIEWDRDDPPRLRGPALARYRKLRNAILSSVANEIGGSIVVADLEPDGRVFTSIHQSASRGEA